VINQYKKEKKEEEDGATTQEHQLEVCQIIQVQTFQEHHQKLHRGE